MAPTTEIVVLKLKEPAETLEGAGEGAVLWQDSISKILSQDGAQRVYWGKAVEDPSLVRMFVEWDSIDHHRKFQASEEYKPFVEKVLSTFSEITFMAHANLKDLYDTAQDALSSPATELLSVFFPAEYTTAQQDKFEAGIHQFIKNLEGKAKGTRAAAAGWGFEDDLPNLKIAGLKGRTFFLFIGWDAVEDHLQFRTTDAYKDNIHFIRDAEDLRDFLNMHYHAKVITK